MKRYLYFVICLFVLISCGNGRSNKVGSAKEFEMDGTWKGTLPCADCPGIEYILTLQPEGNYKMTVIYIDGEGDGIDVKLYSDGKVVRTSKDDSYFLRLLPPPGNDTVYFKIVDGNTLRLVNKELEEPQNAQLYNIVKEEIQTR